MNNPSKHLALLVIDMQDSLLKIIPDKDSLIRRCQFSIKAASMLDCHIAYTEQHPEKLGQTNSCLAALASETAPRYSKTGFSALSAPNIKEWIEEKEIDHLLLLGIETPICIYQTAVDALSEGLGVTLLEDCISQRRETDRTAVLQQLIGMGAHVLPSETIFYSLISTAEHPAFGAFNKLVKYSNE